jgi:acetylornithine deacetylase/succinyl-diaminopimelate desuccinylase
MPDPFTPKIKDGMLFGRGAVDMKGGIAGQICAMIALKRAGVVLEGDLVLTGVIAEEDSTSLGSLHVIEHGPRPDMVVVSEPTGLDVVTAHKGFDYYRIDVQGRANHSSRPDKGVSAVYKGAKIVSAIENGFIACSCARTHPLLGHASLNVAAMLGYANNEAVTVLRRAPGDKPPGAVVPDICTIYMDRRRIPGESLDEVLGDFEGLLAELATADPDLDAKASFTPACPELPSHPPLDTDPNHQLVRTCVRFAAEHAGSPPEARGVPFWSDAALFNDYAKIPSIVFGPGDVAVAHSNHEHVPVDQLTKGARVFTLLAASLLRAR